MPSKNDLEFAKAAIQARYVTEVRVKECLEEQKKVEKKGKTTSLDHVLFQRGLLTPKQLTELQNKLGRRIIFCDDCHAKLNVFDFEPGSKVKCPKCSESVLVPVGPPARPDQTQGIEKHEEKPTDLARLLDGVEPKKGPEKKKPSVAKPPAPAKKPTVAKKGTKPSAQQAGSARPAAPAKKGLLDEDLELLDIDDEPTIQVPPQKKKEESKVTFDDDDLVLLDVEVLDEKPKEDTIRATKEKLPPPKPRDPALADTAHDVPSAKKMVKPPSRLGLPGTRSKKK